MSNNERLGWSRVSQGKGEPFQEAADPGLNPEEALIAAQGPSQAEEKDEINLEDEQHGGPHERQEAEDPTATAEHLTRIMAAGPQVNPEIEDNNVLSQAKKQVDILRRKLGLAPRRQVAPGKSDKDEGKNSFRKAA